MTRHEILFSTTYDGNVVYPAELLLNIHGLKTSFKKTYGSHEIITFQNIIYFILKLKKGIKLNFVNK